jgi:hypothetical protein
MDWLKERTVHRGRRNDLADRDELRVLRERVAQLGQHNAQLVSRLVIQ